MKSIPAIAIFILLSMSLCVPDVHSEVDVPLQSNYIPDANTPVKYVILNFHVIQNPVPVDEAENFENIEGTKVYFEKLVRDMNAQLQNNSRPTDPVEEVCGDCYIRDTRLRVALAGLYFTPDDRWNQGIWSGINTDEALQNNPETEINIFLVRGGTGATGRANPPTFNSGRNHFIISRDIYNGYNAESPEKSRTWGTAKHFLHELGHNFGLHHTYNGETCDPDNPDFLADVFGPEPESDCYHRGGWDCNIPETSCTNNIMGGTKSAGYFSPLQLGRIHRNLTHSSISAYTVTHPGMSW